MKKIMITSIVCLLFFCSFQTVHAQSLDNFRKLPANKKALLITDSLSHVLSLSDVQYKTVYTITLDGMNKAFVIVHADKSRFSKGRELKAILGNIENKMKSILTRTQFKMYEEKKEETIAYYRQKADDEKFHF